MTDDNNSDDRKDFKRRTVLQGAGAASGAGLVGGSFSVSAGAKGHEPCFKEFECSEGDIYLKFELVEDDDTGECELEQVEGPETDLQINTIPEGSCDPKEFEFRTTEYVVEDLLVYGGQSCWDPVEDGDKDEYPLIGGNLIEFDPDIENPGGQQAGISNIQFCLREADDGELPELNEWQADLIEGDVIFDFATGSTYDNEDRLIQARNSCDEDDELTTLLSKNSPYGDCDVNDDDITIAQDITPDTGAGEVTAALELPDGGCGDADFALVIYQTESCAFDGGDDQVVCNVDSGPDDESGIVEFTVDLPAEGCNPPEE